MNIIMLILVVVALVLFVLGAIGIQSKYNLIAAGLAFYMLSLLASTIVKF